MVLFLCVCVYESREPWLSYYNVLGRLSPEVVDLDVVRAVERVDVTDARKVEARAQFQFEGVVDALVVLLVADVGLV